MKEVLLALNRLVEGGLLKSYAIGGAIGASFYLPAMQTEDVDAFVVLAHSDRFLASLTPVYEALKTMGGVEEREYVRFGEWPLQILTDANELIGEAIREAVAVDYEEIPTRIFRPEYLCVIALQTGRAKDYARVALFLESKEVDREALEALALRFGLAQRLKRVFQSMEGGAA